MHLYFGGRIMGKVKEYYQEQINNGSYYESPEIEYYMTYGGRYGRWIPSLINWYLSLIHI